MATIEKWKSDLDSRQTEEPQPSSMEMQYNRKKNVVYWNTTKKDQIIDLAFQVIHTHGKAWKDFERLDKKTGVDLCHKATCTNVVERKSRSSHQKTIIAAYESEKKRVSITHLFNMVVVRVIHSKKCSRRMKLQNAYLAHGPRLQA